jgi:CubicO group peptidase (beta-lactamase class C family)
MMRNLGRRTLLAGVAASALARPSLAAGEGWPGAAWNAASLAGWDEAGLAAARAYADSIGTATFAVVQRGQMVANWGGIDRRLELHSMRKSLLSALIGIAVSRRQIDLDATMARLGIDDVPPSLTDIEKQATVRQLLQARSGIYHPALYETPGMARRRPVRGSHAPGTFWYYNNWDFNALGTIYERAVGKSIFAAFADEIAGPLQMQDYRIQDGRYVRGDDQSLYPAYPFHMSARDLARFGLLYARGGVWQGRQIVPAAWVRESTTAHSETYIGSGYGYLWWTGFPDRRVGIMDLPPGGFWADGAHGQFIFVDPVNDLVAVHQTDGDDVSDREKGHLMYLVQVAARLADPGSDPGDAGQASRRRRR